MQGSDWKFEEANPSIKTNRKNQNGDPITTTNAWWEDKEFQKNVGILPKDDDDESEDSDQVAAIAEESTTAWMHMKTAMVNGTGYNNIGY